MKKIIEERKDIAFYLKMFPFNNHVEAYEKSKSIVCEKSLTLLEDAYEQKPLPKPKCETAAVDETIKLAQKLGITTVPTLILPDGRLFVGATDAKTLISSIEN
jgi:thiol:disulfide interchange protein DsbC